MRISKKLYLNFGLILALLVMLCVMNILAVQREHASRAATTRATELANASESVRYHMMMNRLALTSYLMSGDSRELDAANQGELRLNESLKKARELSLSEQQRAAFERLRESEQSWHQGFLHPLVEKRKQVDSGDTTVADAYLSPVLDRYIAGTQLGITLASLGLGWVGEPAIAAVLDNILETFGMTEPPVGVHTAAALTQVDDSTAFQLRGGAIRVWTLPRQSPVSE